MNAQGIPPFTLKTMSRTGHAPVSGASLAMIMVAAQGLFAGPPSESAGYLRGKGEEQGRIRLQAPAKPQIPSLPPLPQTYIPEPKHTAEFIAQLHSTSSQFSTNFMVQVTAPDPAHLGTLLPATTGTVPPPSISLEATSQKEAILGYFSQGTGTNTVPATPATPPPGAVPILLPVHGILQPRPAVSGSSRATYEVR